MEANLAYRFQDLGYSVLLKNNMELAKTVKGKEFKVDILCNITVNPIKEILEFYLRSLSLNPVIRFGNYDNIVQDTFAMPNSDLVIVFYELVNLTEDFHLQAELLTETDVSEIIEKCKNDIDIVFSNLSSRQVLFNSFSSIAFSGSQSVNRNIERIEHALNSYISQQRSANIHLVNLNRIIGFLGAEASFDKKKFYKYKSLYKIDFLKHYVAAIENFLLRMTGKLKK